MAYQDGSVVSREIIHEYGTAIIFAFDIGQGLSGIRPLGRPQNIVDGEVEITISKSL